MKRNHFRAVTVIAASAVLGALALAGCSSSPSTPSTDATTAAATPSGPVDGGGTTIRVGVNNATGAVPILVAEQQGFFTEHDINVQHQVITDITQIPAALGKSLDLGFSVGPITINAASQGLPIVAVLGNEYDDASLQGFHIIATKGISSAKDLAGKTIGAPTITGNLTLATKYWLAANGVDVNSVKFVQVATPNLIDQMNQGLIDAAEMQYPFISVAKAAGLSDLGDPIEAMGYPTSMSGWIGNTDWVSANANAVEAFRQAMSESVDWIKANPDAARKVLADFTSLTADQVATVPLDYTTDLTPDGLKAWGDVMTQQGGFAGTVDYDALVQTN